MDLAPVGVASLRSLRGHVTQLPSCAVHRSKVDSKQSSQHYSVCLGVASCVCLTRVYPRRRYSTPCIRLNRQRLRCAVSTTYEGIDVSEDDDYIEQQLDDLRSLRARDLKLHLQGLKVDTSSCLDKESLLELLNTQGRQALKATQPSQDGRSRRSGMRATLEELPKEAQERVNALRNMETDELKSELESLGLRTDTCIDKEAMIEILLREGLGAVERDMVLRRVGRHDVESRSIPKEVASAFPWRKTMGRKKRVTVRFFTPTGVHQYGLENKRVIVIEVGIGMTDGRFVVDTVAQANRISPEVAQTVGCRDEGTPDWMDPFTVDKYSIRNVSFSQMGWIDGLAAANPNKGFCCTTLPFRFPKPPNTCGTVGIELLQRFDWDFDFEKSAVKVCVTPKRQPLRSQKPVPFDLTGMKLLPVSTVKLPVPLLACVVELRHANRDGWLCLTGIVDLAAPCTMCNRAVAQRLGIETRSSADELHKTFQVEMLLGDGPDGPVRMKAPIVVGVDEDIKRFEELGLAKDWPTLLLGNDVLCRSRMIFSHRLQSLWLPLNSW